MSEPLVSILIPTYNRAKLLVRAVDSAVGQTYDNIEVIVFDNASSDETGHLVGRTLEPRLRYFRHDHNIGMYPNWNACLEEAKGVFCLYLSDDDYLEPDVILKLVRLIKDREHVGMVYCRPKVISGEGNVIEYGWKAPEVENTAHMLLEYLQDKRSVQPSGTMLRTRDLLEIGGFNENRYGIIADVAAWITVAWKCEQIAMVNEPYVVYQRHDSNATLHYGIEKWGRSFSSLGELCYHLYSDRGDTGKASLAQVLCRRKAKRYMALALLQNLRNGLARKTVFTEFWKCHTYFVGSDGLYLAARILGELLLPRSMSQKVRRLSSHFRRRSSAIP